MVTYSLGVDGGGSKTDCVILRADGEIIGRGAAGPSNPLRVGFPAAFEAVRTKVGERARETLDVLEWRERAPPATP